MRPDVLALAEQIDKRLAQLDEREPGATSALLGGFLLKMQDANHDLIVLVSDAIRSTNPSMYMGHIKALLVRIGVLLTVAYHECEQTDRAFHPQQD